MYVHTLNCNRALSIMGAFYCLLQGTLFTTALIIREIPLLLITGSSTLFTKLGRFFIAYYRAQHSIYHCINEGALY